MYKIILIEAEAPSMDYEVAELEARQFICHRMSLRDDIFEALSAIFPDIIFIDLDAFPISNNGRDFIRNIRTESQLPILATCSNSVMDSFDFECGINDFILKTATSTELALRIKHLLFQAGSIEVDGVIQFTNLVMDTAKYEVTVAGQLVDLSFKEYELLRVLISNKGMVLTRQTLLDKVWGYDYFGGDRTVDVHIRRLRSKIEGRHHNFVETVRNVGYKFKESFTPNSDFSTED
jgi:two-component system alkaline phosphatase synthesis response regulator PhoP